MAAAAAGRRTESAFPTFVAAHGFDAEVYATQPSPKIPRLPEVSAATVAFRSRQRSTHVCVYAPAQPLVLRCAGSPHQGKTGFQPRVGPLAGSIEPRRSGGLVHPPTRRGRTPGERHPCPLLRPVAVVGLQQRDGGSTQTHGPDGGLASGRVRSHRVRFPLRQQLPRTASTPLQPSPAPCSPAWRRATCTSSASVAAQPTFPDSTLPPAPWGDGLHPKRGCPGRIGRSVDPSPSHRVVAPGRAGRSRRPGRHRSGAGPSEHRRERRTFPRWSPSGSNAGSWSCSARLGTWWSGLVGAFGAVVVATVLSPIAPLGEARVAESSTGIRLRRARAHTRCARHRGGGGRSWPLAGRAGGTCLPVRRPDRRCPRPPGWPVTLWSFGAPPSVVIGVRNALERRSGGATVPVGSALLGTVLAVIALCGTAVFGASLSHLTATPKLYGDPFQLNISDPNSGGTPDPVLLAEPRARPGRHRNHQGHRPTRHLDQQGGRRRHRRNGHPRSSSSSRR